MLWKERLWILAHLPNLITTFLLAEMAHLQQNNLVLTEWHCCPVGNPYLAYLRDPLIDSDLHAAYVATH